LSGLQHSHEVDPSGMALSVLQAPGTHDWCMAAAAAISKITTVTPGNSRCVDDVLGNAPAILPACPPSDASGTSPGRPSSVTVASGGGSARSGDVLPGACTDAPGVTA
jgi:hypothetical protein